MKVLRMTAAMAVMTALAGLAPGSAEAQEPVPPVQEERIEVTDELLERFVAVYPAVVDVARTAQSELGTAETAEEAQAIQADAQARVAEVLSEGEITPVEYEAVVVRLNDDPDLMAKFERMLEEEEQEMGGV